MSTVVRNDSPTDMAFHDSNFSDPCLAAPLDPDQLAFKSAAIRLTPVPDDRDMPAHTTMDPSSYCNDAHATSYSDWLSPADDFSSELSTHTSPSADHLSSTFTLNSDHSWRPQQHHPSQLDCRSSGLPNTTSDTSSLGSPQMTVNPSQLLTPNLTHNPTPSPETISSKRPDGFAFLHHPQPLSVITSPPSENLGINDLPESARTKSPIVKVESYSRGDSPDQEVSYWQDQPSQSFTHLSPNECDEELDAVDPPDWNLGQPVPRAADGTWIPNATTGQGGLDPASRDDAFVPSPNQMEAQRHLNEKNADIQSWSVSVSAANSEAGDGPPVVHRGRGGAAGSRRRAKSAGDPSLQQDYFNMTAARNGPVIPGPGRLVHVDSDDESSEPESELDDSRSASPAVAVEESLWTQEPESMAPLEQLEDEEPSPHQFLGSPPWRDPERDSTPRASHSQPQSSSHAMVEFERRNRDIETVSRVATWGTKRISKADIDSIVGGSSIQGLRIGTDKNDDQGDKSKKHERRSSLWKLLQRRPSPSNNLKRQLSDISISRSPANAGSPDEGSKSPPQRKDSFPHRLSIGRSARSPSMSTGGALVAVAGQMAAIGSKDTVQAVSPSSTSNPWNKVRGRSRSEVPHAPGLIDLMTSHGGPPVGNIAYSSLAPPTTLDGPGPTRDAGDDDDEDEDMVDEKGLVMDFAPSSRLPVPTLEGFRTQITQLNPRLPPALIERFASEQVRRYKKLVESKLSHTHAVGRASCSAGKHCFALGGQATLLAPRTSPQSADAAHTQFHIPGQSEADDDPQALGESAVTAAQFPPGVPLPPVKRLPAQFECPVCFQVKKFQKPSDWTKHVHEDVQPFTCTFPHCPDPKSFKRKADWVRHESERHRKLEWWTCEVPDCHHTCYRKDNFVQHLVREHKMPEPKVKKTKSKLPSDMQEESYREREIERLWELVERCRHDTPRGPRDEPCRFCGNVCSSWKKLTVHLAKHMEQIAMPVLGLVNERDLASNPPAGRADPDVGPQTTVPETQPFAPALNGISADPELSMNFAQSQQYGPGMSLHPNYVPQFTALSGSGVISAEPDSYDPSVSLSGPPGAYLDQTRLMPTHQNSVTYPPPFNAGPRPRSPQQDLGMMPGTYGFSTSPPEMQGGYGPHGQYLTAGTEPGYAYQSTMPSGMSYPPASGGY